MIDYSVFYRRSINTGNLASEIGVFDIFVSAFNCSERIALVFNSVSAAKKIYHVHPEYQFESHEVPRGSWLVSAPDEIDEMAQMTALINAIGAVSGAERICIDITGFMRSSLCFLLAKLRSLGFRHVSAIYSEPRAYSKQDNTSFSVTTTGAVRPVRGMAGSGGRTKVRDYLIVGVGYDHALVGEVLHNKDGAVTYPIFGFPSLSPDMYQQSAVRAARSGDKALDGSWVVKRRFAPANDPFATAAIVAETVRGIRRDDPTGHIYLSPLSTKAQALGFALYWMLEGQRDGSVTMLLPECDGYSRETSSGLNKVWLYDVEM